MWIPLLILCLGAIGAGYLGVFGKAPAQHEGGWFHHFVGQVTDATNNFILPEGSSSYSTPGTQPGQHILHITTSTVEITETPGRISAPAMMTLSAIISLVGIALAFYFHKLNRPASAALAKTLRPLVTFLNNKWYFDELYSYLLLKPLRLLAILFSYFDRYIIDSLVFLVAFFPQLLGYTLKPTQRGLLQRYAVGMLAGLAAIVLGVLYLTR